MRTSPAQLPVVRLTEQATRDIRQLPSHVVDRLEGIFDRLSRWPDVSGVERIKYHPAGYYRIRTGDWRVVFRPEGPNIVVDRVLHRSKAYER